MATAIQARVQLSKDIGDHFTSAITSNGAANGSTLIDTALEDFKDDDLFSPFSNVTFLITGTVSGIQNEERAATSKSTSTVTMRRNFSAQIDILDTYEMHRLFTAAEKNEAVTRAIELVFPLVWAPKTAEVTIVNDQFDYDITSSNFLDDSPHQIHLISADDPEITRPFYDWEVRYTTGGAARIHLFSRFNKDEKLRLFGITTPAISDFSGTDLLILSAQAAVYLFETNIGNVLRDDTARMIEGLRRAEQLLARRVTRHMRIVPFGRQPHTVAFRSSGIDRNFRRT